MKDEKSCGDLLYAEQSGVINKVLEALENVVLPGNYTTYGINARKEDGMLYINFIFEGVNA